MYRSVSRSKWKDVLGFDDGSLSASPIYRYTPTPLHHLHQTGTPPAQLYPSFPRVVTVAHNHSSLNGTDILLGSYHPTPQYGEGDMVKQRLLLTTPLFHVGIFEESRSNIRTSRPEVMLHAGSGRGSRIVAFAKFHTVTDSTEVTLCLGQYGIGAAGSLVRRPGTSPSDVSFSKPGEVLGEEDVLRTPRYRCVKVERKIGWTGKSRGSGFSCWVERFRGGIGNEGKERFEWRDSRERRAMDFRRAVGSMMGNEMKLVCVRTKQVVASFLVEDKRGNESTERLGVFKFLADEEGLGGEFEVLAIMSLLSDLERSRRKCSREVKRGICRDRRGLGGFFD